MKSSQIVVRNQNVQHASLLEKPSSSSWSSSSRTKHNKTMATPNRYGPTQLPPPESASVSSVSSFTANMSELWMRLCCTTPSDEGEYFGNPGDAEVEDEADITEMPSVIIPPSSLACMGFVSNRSEVSQSYNRKFARRIVNMRHNRHGVEVAKATQSELITFEELLREFTL